jgi:hypothetical protein
MRPERGKLRGEIHLDSKAIGGLLVRCKSAIFFQTEQLLGIFSTGTEKGGFTGFSGIEMNSGNGKKARKRRICPQGPDPLFPASLIKDT